MADKKQFNSSLLDRGIDDIDDLPGFRVPPNGVYSLKANMTLKVINDKDTVEAGFEVIECIEQNDPNEEPCKPGDKFNVLFQLGNEIGEGKLKEFVVPFADHFGERNLGKLVTETIKDVIITATIKQRADKNDPDKKYAGVSNVQVA